MQTIFKRFSGLLVAVALTCALCATSFATSGLDNFQSVNSYDGRFTDVSGWYQEYVVRGYELGLFDGTSATTFSPNSSMTVAEAVKLAASLHSIYTTGSADFAESSPWWRVYADYSLENGIYDEDFSDYSNAISRARFAQLLAAALPDEALSVMNTVADGAIPDVSESDSYGAAVYKLYRAGVLTGSDSAGTFNPSTNIRRSEVAAIMVRMVSVTSRQSVTLTSPTATVGSTTTGTTVGTTNTATVGDTLNAEQLYAQASPSVFYLVTYDSEGEAFASGSGVFLSSTGEAVTNWHVIDGATTAKVTTVDGKTYDVAGIYDYDVEKDLARIQVKGTGFTAMPVNYSGEVRTGATVYAIGNPLGLESTLSVGIISAAKRVVDGATYIQITTPISSGSSGGALINDKGELIGITSASVSSGQNLNLAVPITDLQSLSATRYRSVATVMQEYTNKLKAGFTLSKTAVTLRPGQETTVTITIPDIPSGYATSYILSDYGVALCSWGEWDTEKDQVDLTLYAQYPGTVTVTVRLHDRADTVLDERTIQVIVTNR
jgi:S1-C subfamily serine protease